MQTEHVAAHGDSRNLSMIDDESIGLVVTSPPYPMIEMWDECFGALAPESLAALGGGDGSGAFESMHRELDRVWEECRRVLTPGGFLCINIGDAVRTLDGDFRLWPNHVRIAAACLSLGFSALPDILWRKPTNAPNKFMGSGMLPAGAYVTYEHEYILVFRKGRKREFPTAEDKARRRTGAFFWEERNVWFSDIWSGIVGTRQKSDDLANRSRSGAFPIEVPFRLIAMYSVPGDRVLDPFLGLGTTTIAAIALGRSSIGIEYSGAVRDAARHLIGSCTATACRRTRERLIDHEAFVRDRLRSGKSLSHRNEIHATPVMTAQESDLQLFEPANLVETTEGIFSCEHRTSSLVDVPLEAELPFSSQDDDADG